jgi:hypothetical protein
MRFNGVTWLGQFIILDCLLFVLHVRSDESRTVNDAQIMPDRLSALASSRQMSFVSRWYHSEYAMVQATLR